MSEANALAVMIAFDLTCDWHHITHR
jgi:hypothetical protein